MPARNAKRTLEQARLSLAVEHVPLDTLAPYSHNARKHPEDQLNRLSAMLRRFGFLVPVIVDALNVIVAGHGRILAARRLWDAGETIPGALVYSVPVLRVAHLRPTQVKAYRIADNKLASLSTFDDALLGKALKELAASGFAVLALGFSDDEMAALTGSADAALAAAIAGARDALPVGEAAPGVVNLRCLMTRQQRDSVQAMLERARASRHLDNDGAALAAIAAEYLANTTPREVASDAD